MRIELRRTLSALAACIITAPCALAAQSSQFGSIAGKVTDKNSGQPIEAATVTVYGTSYGTLTKANGTYTILGVPPGTYDVSAKRVGYQQVTAQNVVVRPDISRSQDFELSTATFALLPLIEQASAQMVPVRAAAAASAGPGSAFGIDAYECANCGVARYRDSVHAVYTFGAEPVVVAVGAQARDRIRPGDVIVAVNGTPITTRAGADMFAYPDSGEIKLTLRRNGTNIDVVSYSLNAARLAPTAGSTGDVPRAAMGGRGGATAQGGVRGGGGGRGGRAAAGGFVRPAGPLDSVSRVQPVRTCNVVVRSRGDTVTAGQASRCATDSLSADSPRSPARAGGRDGAVAPTATTFTSDNINSSTVELRNYGFTLSCRPDCTRMRSQSGVLYWKFDGYPSVAVLGVVKDGLAARVGIREGDVVVSVNGLSPLTEEGAVLLNRSERELELTIEVSRAGKREKYVLKL